MFIRPGPKIYHLSPDVYMCTLDVSFLDEAAGQVYDKIHTGLNETEFALFLAAFRQNLGSGGGEGWINDMLSAATFLPVTFCASHICLLRL